MRCSVTVRCSFALLGALACALPAAGRAEDGAEALALAKAASGGARWDDVARLHGVGSRIAGGLEGRWRRTLDVVRGRSSEHYEFGRLDTAEGYDGTLAWRRDPAGEVGLLDAPETLRQARTQAWLDARGYWFPARLGGARFGTAQTRGRDGERYRVVNATPQGGDPVELWFDTATGLLARAVQREGQDRLTSAFSDYRDVDGLRLPFRVTIDATDAAGRTDERRRVALRYERIALNAGEGDADFAAPAMSATARIDNAERSTRIPFELLNNHIYVHATVDGKPARFLVDSGGTNLLTPAAARRLGLASEGRFTVAGAGDATVDLALARAHTLRVGDAVLEEPVFDVIDLGDMPRVEGLDFDGFVGYELMRRFATTIDYAQRTLTFAEPVSFVPPTGATALRFVQADRAPIVQGRLDGVPIRLWVDTGSRSSLTFFSPFVRTHGLLAKYRAKTDAVTGWGIAGASREWPVRLGTLELGGFSLNGLAGDLTTTTKGAFADPDLGADLGGGAMKRFTVAFDYAKKTMYLAPNAQLAFADAFDRSGLWLMGDGDALTIVDVAAGSAGAHANLAVGDRVRSLGGEAAQVRSLSEWRARLRELPTGTRLVIAFERGGSARTTELVLAERIPATWKGE